MNRKKLILRYLSRNLDNSGVGSQPTFQETRLKVKTFKINFLTFFLEVPSDTG